MITTEYRGFIIKYIIIKGVECLKVDGLDNTFYSLKEAKEAIEKENSFIYIP